MGNYYCQYHFRKKMSYIYIYISMTTTLSADSMGCIDESLTIIECTVKDSILSFKLRGQQLSG